MSTLDLSGFEYEPEKESGKEGILFFGQKGSGKTSGAYLLPGPKVVLSYDGKSLRAQRTVRPNDDSITVLDARKYVTHIKAKMTEGGRKTIDYTIWLLEEVRKRGGCDWVVIDGLDILIEAAEMAMRYDHKIGPLDTFANLGWWKDRKINLRIVHETAFSVAKKGVIWTTYVDKDEIVNNATLVKRTDIPKWMDIIMYDTDAVVKTYTEQIEGKTHFKLHVVSSKIPRFTTGDVLDVTNVLSIGENSEGFRVGAEDPVDLDRARKRKQVRQRLDKCPKCGEKTVNEMGVIHCTKCDWVHEDEV